MSEETPLRYYTGVGSRKAPPVAIDRMVAIGAAMAALGWVLRSGGADGSDTAFEVGCKANNGDREIYLPWKGFNGHDSTLFFLLFPKVLQDKALELAASVHPAWGAVKSWAKLLHARNVFQVLGQDLNTPSERVICWTPGGKCVGGTATAIRLAEMHNIPVINLGVE